MASRPALLFIVVAATSALFVLVTVMHRTPRHTIHDLRLTLTVQEGSVAHSLPLAGSSPPPLAAVPSSLPRSSSVECCSLRSLPPLNITLQQPVKMTRPIRVLMRDGNFDGEWPCDVPCEFCTNEPASHEVDVVVGEAAPPTVATGLRKANPHLLTAARSMESAINYPSLRKLPSEVDAAMTTDLTASAVPVVYLTRSSIAKWNSVPVQWNASALRAHFSRRDTPRGGGGGGGSGSGVASAAVFVAKNCHSRNGREALVKKLSSLLRGGVDRPGNCLNTRSWPSCSKPTKPTTAASTSSKCSKHAVLRRYPFYLAFENSDDVDYVSEKVFHALEAGTLPVYAGAPNVAEFLPPHSVVEVKDFEGDANKLAAHLASLLDDPDKYLGYFAWKRGGNLPEAFQRKFAFVGTHAKCRLCRWAWARKYRYGWSQREQRPLSKSEGALVV